MSRASTETDDNTIYKVVINNEEQYSIWPAYLEPPLGWTDVGIAGCKIDCLAHIKGLWIDMRPLSLRKQMEQNLVSVKAAFPRNSTKRTDLVTSLSEGDHPVTVVVGPDRTCHALKEALDRRYVHVKFTDTRSGTELGLRLDTGRTDLSKADFERRMGSVHLVGRLILNYVVVECVADVNLSTLEGTGHLTPMLDVPMG